MRTWIALRTSFLYMLSRWMTWTVWRIISRMVDSVVNEGDTLLIGEAGMCWISAGRILSVETPGFISTIACSWLSVDPSTCSCVAISQDMDAPVLAARSSSAPCSSSLTSFSVESWHSSKLALSLELKFFLAYLEGR
jgi:hypothetical protein